jgi:CRP-like cAMP-binding protein
MPTSSAIARRQALARVPIFSGLRESDLDELARVAHTRRLAARDELMHKGDDASQVYVVIAGRLRVTTTSADGADVVLNLMDPGDVIGELSLLAGGQRTATVTALEACELLALDRRDFLPFLRDHPAVAVELLQVLAKQVIRVSEFVEDTVFLNLPTRLAKRLTHLARAYGRDVDSGVRIELKLSQHDLGTMVGTSRESVNKQMRIWEEQGLVTSKQGYVTIHRPRELEELSGFVSP